jgi:hypothetical protein
MGASVVRGTKKGRGDSRIACDIDLFEVVI